MTKKEYVTTLLKALINDRPLARGLLVLVRNNVFDDTTIDALTDIFKEAMVMIKDAAKKEKLQQGIAYLDKIKAKEEKEKAGEASELEDMEKMIAGI